MIINHTSIKFFYVNLTCLWIAITMLFTTGFPACAAPVSSSMVVQTADGWLHKTANPFGAFHQHTVREAIPHCGSNGAILYFEVRLHPQGFMIMPANDRMNPVLAFAGHGRFDPSTDHPLGALLLLDLPERLRQVAKGDISAAENWRLLRSSRPRRQTLVSEERVAPLLNSAWDQGSVDGVLCYNYWTPHNYACGGVATALSQLMRFHRHPMSGVGVRSFPIKVNGESQERFLLGGDGQGGPYIWDRMPAAPGQHTPDLQRQSIGGLCHDVGVAAGTHYSATATATQFTGALNALRAVFYYSHHLIGYAGGGELGAALPLMINPGLDAGLPAVLGIFHGDTGHAVVCDGYGYIQDTLYHHLNLGWGSSLAADNVWYHLPRVDTTGLTYDAVRICAYNIFPHGTGEIISGRVTDGQKRPLEHVALTLIMTNGPTLTARTDANGIYAFAAVPSDTAATVTAVYHGYSFAPRHVRTGTSRQTTAECGNLWQIDFIAARTHLPEPADYDGDSLADYALYDTAGGNWRIWQSAADQAVADFQLGGAGWLPVPADYDGDGKADPAVYHQISGIWKVMLSGSRYLITSLYFGGEDWRPVPADYDGDGRADPAVYHSVRGDWIALLSDNAYKPGGTEEPFGGSGWEPVVADYDGDGRADPAIYDSRTGAWQVLMSDAAYRQQSGAFVQHRGGRAVPADYDGDGKADPAVYHADGGQWIIQQSSAAYTSDMAVFGGPESMPAPADYNGNGAANIGLYDFERDAWSHR